MSNEMFNIVKLVLMLLCAIISAYVIPWVREKYTQSELSRVVDWVAKAVECAEMLFEDGTEKKKYCMNFIEKILKEMNVNLSPEQINILIESAVKELKIKQR